jgi:uncharacterized heparinase superfamily protein
LYSSTYCALESTASTTSTTSVSTASTATANNHVRERVVLGPYLVNGKGSSRSKRMDLVITASGLTTPRSNNKFFFWGAT